MFKLELPAPSVKDGRDRIWQVGEVPETCPVAAWRGRRLVLEYKPDAVGERWTLIVRGYTGMPPRILRYKTRAGVIERLASIFGARAVVLTGWRD